MHLEEITIRPLDGFTELTAGVALQKETWGETFDDVVSAATMLVVQKVGGVAAGAFDGEGELIGIVFGLTGPRGGELVHWSHMLAVQKAWQNQGLGRRLKLYQRGRMLAEGVRRMHWTYDPLEGRNAHFNLNRLGAGIASYERDLYGPGDSSPIHRGMGTDRFVVDWRLDAARVQEAVAGRRPPLPPPAREAPLAPSPDAPDVSDLPHAPLVRVAIPDDVQLLKASDPGAAPAWRKATRRAFEHYLGLGHHVVGFYRDAKAGRCYYVLQQ